MYQAPSNNSLVDNSEILISILDPSRNLFQDHLLEGAQPCLGPVPICFHKGRDSKSMTFAFLNRLLPKFRVPSGESASLISHLVPRKFRLLSLYSVMS